MAYYIGDYNVESILGVGDTDIEVGDTEREREREI